MGDAAGLTPFAQPASVVAGVIIEAFRTGTFHVWPDATAQQIESQYEGFARNIVEADFSEG
ncbi:MAG: hypothetical protein AAGJ54_04340 [Planctomycetota bacterium]